MDKHLQFSSRFFFFSSKLLCNLGATMGKEKHKLENFGVENAFLASRRTGKASGTFLWDRKIRIMGNTQQELSKSRAARSRY